MTTLVEQSRHLDGLRSSDFLMLPIIESVCGLLRVTEEEILGPSRRARFVEARQVAFWLARNHTSLTYENIGEVFSNRDHTTVLHGVQNIEQRMRVDPILSQRAMYLDREVKKKFEQNQ